MNTGYLTTEFKEFVRKTLELWHVPGLAIVIVQDGRIILCEGFGLRNIEKNLSVTPGTLFPIGSCTKAFTGMSIGMLVDSGMLDWDKPVREYLPTFKLQDKFATERMTPRDLLAHRSGLPSHDLMWYASNFSRREIFNRLPHLEPSRDFRYSYQYQNIMYIMAGLLVEEIVGMSWEQFVQTRIFDRLGMTNSNLSTVVTQQAHDFASPYIYQDDQLRQIPFYEADGDKDALGPAGNISSCVVDMAKWLQVQLNRGKLGQQQFVSESTLAQMHTPHIFIDDPEVQNRLGYEVTSYGLGWRIQSHKGQVLVHHTGGIDGFAAFTSLMPRHNIGVVTLSNSDSYNNAAAQVIAYTVYDRLLGLVPTDWNALIKPYYDDLVGAEKLNKEKSSAERKPGTQMSHPIESYQGNYEHPGYGVVSIKKVDYQLQMVINDKLTLLLKHYHYDIFEAYLERYFHRRMNVAFSNGLKGDIAQVAIQMEPMVDDVIFRRTSM
jgi:CubicO group peptidase (beta-lactamase class C family)